MITGNLTSTPFTVACWNALRLRKAFSLSARLNHMSGWWLVWALYFSVKGHLDVPADVSNILDNPVQHIRFTKDACYITVWVLLQGLLIHHLWYSEHLPRRGLGQGLIGTLERGRPVKRTPMGILCAAVESCSPFNPQEPPATATGKWGIVKEVGVGCARVCGW